MKHLNVAIVGSGYIAQYHAEAIRSIPGVEIGAICSLDRETLRAMGNRFGVDCLTDRVEELWGSQAIDLAVICTPNLFHRDHAIEFLRRGKDLLIEKPLARTSTEAEEIVEASRLNSRLVMVGHMWRFDVEAQWVLDQITLGKIGRVLKTHGYGIHENWGPSGWFVDRNLAGGGALVDMGVHAIDTVRFLLSDPAPQSVFAQIGTHFGDYEVDDTGIVLITWDSGVTSIVESGWWHPKIDGPEAATRLTGSDGFLSLFPTQGVQIEGPERSIVEFTSDFPRRREHCDQVIYTRQMEHFVECVRTRQEPVPGLAEGMTVMRIVDAAYESSRTGEVVWL
ncbi:MAG: Gfo/Idh/MocA family oxidoreductase [Acidobacteriota bacterium]|nr:MAG: Gfo/Idh/MocA family oxidoreductase [Acidobacteriota bacterium]